MQTRTHTRVGAQAQAAVIGVLSGLLLLQSILPVIGCGSAPTSGAAGTASSGRDTMSSSITDEGDDEILTAGVDDPANGENDNGNSADGSGDFSDYSIVATQNEEDPALWEFVVASDRGRPREEITIRWEIEGQTLIGPNQLHTFSAPGSYLIRATASDSKDVILFVLTLEITISDFNHPPVADCGDDETVDEGSLVLLYGGGSYDPDDDDLTFIWAQSNGPAVELLSSNEATTSFIAPEVPADTNLTITLTVNDGDLTSQDSVRVYVTNLVDTASVGPTADAGLNQTVTESTLVTLDGTQSADGDGGPLGFAWTQYAGPSVSLSSSTSAVATFEAPAVANGSTVVLSFELIVDENGIQASDDVTITVESDPGGGTPGGGTTDPPTDPPTDCTTDDDCDDGLFCNGPETCVSGSCQTGAAVGCDDGVPCTDDSCNEATQSCDHVTSDALCDNGQFCDGLETCDSILGCVAGSDPCVAQICHEDTDSCEAIDCTTNADCDDGLYCNGVETCAGNSCQAGTPIDCDDGVTCTVDSCNEASDSCDHTANNALCSNGQYCDGAETCDETLGCQAGAPIDCDDGVTCTDDSCNEATDTCVHATNDALCTNGQYCDGAETCNATSGCQAGTAVNCNDGIACTNDSCNEGTDSCVHAPNNALCSNGQYCDGAETCNATSGCQAGTAVNCNDGIGCTNDSCNEGTDSCVHAPSDALCNNGLYCDGIETCSATLGCQGGVPINCDDGIACTSDSCNEGTDSCVHLANDAVCDNGQFCDGSETCNAGVGCLAGSSPCLGQLCNETSNACVDCLSAADCDDGVSCTADSCNIGSGSCQNLPNSALCDNGQFCDGNETCDANLGCLAGSDPCGGDECDEVGDQCVLPTIAASTTSLDFGQTTTSLQFEIWNSGGGTIDYDVVVGGGAPWLSVTPNGGSSSGEHDSITANVDRSALSEGTHQTVISINPSIGSSLSIAVLVSVASADPCVTSSSTWQNFSITPQTGTFTLYFDATPSQADMDGLVGLSLGQAGGFSDSAVIVRFNVDGLIDAWDQQATPPFPGSSGWYSAETSISYSAGTAYHFRMEINVAQHNYSAFVTPGGSGEVVLAQDYGFRAPNDTVTSLNNWTVWADIGTHEVCNFAVGSCVVDSDGDGTADCNDGCLNDPNKTAPGVCGCGVPDTDSDGDGVANCHDQCPGAPDTDSDGDGVANCVDVCPGFDDTIDSDGDGTPDGCESPQLSVNPTNINFGYTTTASSFDVWNSGGGTLTYTIADNAAWLSATPTSGNSSGEHDTIAVTVNRNGLADGDYQGQVTVTPATGSAISVVVSMAVGSCDPPNAVITVSRSSGVVPLAIFFEGTQSTDASGRKIGNSSGGNGLLATEIVEYRWDFGDGTSFSGFNAAHVYESPGTYQVSLTVYTEDCQNTANQTITASQFSGTTYYVRADGADSNVGTGDSPTLSWKSYTKAFSAIANNSVVRSGDRVRFRRGDTFTYSGSVNLGSARNVIVDAYGTNPNKPVIKFTGSGSGTSAAIHSGSGPMSFVDLQFDCDSGGGGRSDIANSWMTNLLLLRVTGQGYWNLVGYTDGLFVVDSILRDVRRQNIFYNGQRLAVVNSSLSQSSQQHNVYGDRLDRALFTGNRFQDSWWGGIRVAGNSDAGSWNVLISDNEFSEIPSALDLKVTCGTCSTTAHNTLIERNYIHDCDYGVRIQRDDRKDVVIRNNLMVNVFSGLTLESVNGGGPLSGVDGLRFVNNTVVTRNVESSALNLGTSDHTNVQIVDNIIQAAGGTAGTRALYVAGGMNEVTCDYNLFYLPNLGASAHAVAIGGSTYTMASWLVGNSFGQDSHSSNANPQFANANDASGPDQKIGTNDDGFMAHSPFAVDSGTAFPGVIDDIRGAARPVDGDGDGTPQSDIGAYEEP